MQGRPEPHLLRIASLPAVRITSLLQTLDAHPALAQAAAPPGLLAPAERVHLDALRIEKRRRDWLLGRWTAKHLLQMHLRQGTGASYPLDALIIGQDPDGAPHAALESLHPQRLTLSISISHSGDRSFCALAAPPGISIGADTELVRAGLDEMARQFFAPAELAWLDGIAAGLRPAGIVTIWSAKEALLKALRVGLRADTRDISCVPARPEAGSDWAPAAVRIGGQLLATEPGGNIGAWFRRSGEYVECLAMWQKDQR